MNNFLFKPHHEDALQKFQSQALKQEKIQENLVIPIKNKSASAKFKLARMRLQGYLLWLFILKDIRKYGTNAHLFNSFGKYRNDLVARFTAKKRVCLTINEKRIKFGYLFNPDSSFSMIWNILVLFMLLYAFFLMPWVMAFVDVELLDSWFITETSIDLIYFFDVIFTFNTAYYDLFGRIVTDRKKICFNYMKTTLILDLISIFPFYLLEQGVIVKSSHLIRIVRITSITRVLRGTKLAKLIKHFTYSETINQIMKFLKLYRGAIRLLLLVFCVLVMSHFVACMWFYTAKLDNFSTNTWVARYNLIDAPLETKYLKSLYFSITILTTVGFGDIVPYTSAEMILCIVWMMLGIGFYSTIISTISSVFSSLDSRRVIISEKINNIDQLGKYYDVDLECTSFLKKKISDHVTYHKKLTEHEKFKIIRDMPKKLRLEIVKNMYNQACEKLRFFREKDSNFLIDIIPRLKYEIVEAEVKVYAKHELAENVYFLIAGRVSYVLSSRNYQFKSVVGGSYFGEIEMVLNTQRKFSVVTEEICEMLIMSSDVFDDMMRDYPVIAQEVIQLSNRRDKKNEECFSQVVKLLEKVEIKKTAGFKELAGQKCINKKKNGVEDYYRDNLTHVELAEMIFAEINEIEKKLSCSHTLLKKYVEIPLTS